MLPQYSPLDLRHICSGKQHWHSGHEKWWRHVLVVADYAFGAALDRDVTTAIERAGGKVIGRTKHPLNTADYSSFLLQAQNSGAEVVGFANAGSDATNSIKQASDDGLPRKQKIAALLMYLHDLHALDHRDLGRVEPYRYILLGHERCNAYVRSALFQANDDFSMPSMDHAGVYAVVLHYLKAAQALDGEVKDGAKVVAKMKETSPMTLYLVRAKFVPTEGTLRRSTFPGEDTGLVKGPWDLYKLMATTPGERAFRPLGEGGCSLAGKGGHKVSRIFLRLPMKRL